MSCFNLNILIQFDNTVPDGQVKRDLFDEVSSAHITIPNNNNTGKIIYNFVNKTKKNYIIIEMLDTLCLHLTMSLLGLLIALTQLEQIWLAAKGVYFMMV